MTDATLSSHDYRIGFGDFNAFFGAWLKRGFFTRQRLYIWLGMAAALSLLTLGTIPVLLSGMNKAQKLPFQMDALFWCVMIAVFVLSCLIFSGIIVYLLTLPLIYVVQLAGFILGSIRRRKQSVALSSQRIAKTVDDAVSETPWSRVHSVTATRQTVLIFTSRNSAMVIPKRAFDTAEMAEAFAASAQHYWTEATGGKDAAKHPEAHF